MKKSLRNLITIAIFTIFILSVSSCGNRGPLVKPAAVIPQINTMDVDEISSLA